MITLEVSESQSAVGIVMSVLMIKQGPMISGLPGMMNANGLIGRYRPALHRRRVAYVGFVFYRRRSNSVANSISNGRRSRLVTAKSDAAAPLKKSAERGSWDYCASFLWPIRARTSSIWTGGFQSLSGNSIHAVARGDRSMKERKGARNTPAYGRQSTRADEYSKPLIPASALVCRRDAGNRRDVFNQQCVEMV